MIPYKLFLLLSCFSFGSEPIEMVESTEPFYQFEIKIKTPEEIDGLSLPIPR